MKQFSDLSRRRRVAMPAREHASLPSHRERRSVAGWALLFLPIIFFEIYLNFTVILFAFGPWPWPVSNPLKLYTFLGGAHLVLFLGYWLGIRRRPADGHIRFPRSLLTLSILAGLLWAPAHFYILRPQTAGIFDAISAVYAGLTNPIDNYADKLNHNLTDSGPSSVIRTTTFLMPLAALMYPLCVVMWRQLKSYQRLAFLLAKGVEIMAWISIGTTKGVADSCLTLPWLIIVAIFRTRKFLEVKTVLRTGAVFIVAISLVVTFFQASKIGETWYAVAPRDNGANISVDLEHPLMKVLPPKGQHIFASLSSYFTQGYYALSLSLEKPFLWTYGLGHGLFTSEASRRIFPPNYILSRSYPGRAQEDGWDVFLRWHSIYPWLASDLSFPGAIVAVALIGMMLGTVWRESLEGNNPFSIGVLYYMIIMLLYFPGNNQVLGFFQMAVPFWCLLALWLGWKLFAQNIQDARLI